jgi:predicted DNA-binding transcriptional regulator AlpA
MAYLLQIYLYIVAKTMGYAFINFNNGGKKFMDYQYLSEKVVAEKTGFSLSKLRNDRSKGRGLPYVKLNKAVRYLSSDIKDYMESHKVIPENE